MKPAPAKTVIAFIFAPVSIDSASTVLETTKPFIILILALSVAIFVKLDDRNLNLYTVCSYIASKYALLRTYLISLNIAIFNATICFFGAGT